MPTKVISRRSKSRPGPTPRWPERIDVSVPAEVKEALESEASRTGSSLSGMVRQVLTEWYEQQNPDNGDGKG